MLAMYGAVIEMINEGWDVNTMKVSDITARAGIGKGTAYEYFSSKEAIITMALGHDMLKKHVQIEKIVDGGGTFEEKTNRIFDYVEEEFGKPQTFCTLVRIGTGSYDISESIRQEYGKLQEMSVTSIEFVLDRLMEQGRREGILSQQNPGLCRTAFLAQLMAYVACLISEKGWNRAGCPVGDCGVSAKEAKRFVYASLVKSLNE